MQPETITPDNLTILECKETLDPAGTQCLTADNLTILECKEVYYDATNKRFTLII